MTDEKIVHCTLGVLSTKVQVSSFHMCVTIEHFTLEVHIIKPEAHYRLVLNLSFYAYFL